MLIFNVILKSMNIYMIIIIFIYNIFWFEEELVLHYFVDLLKICFSVKVNN